MGSTKPDLSCALQELPQSLGERAGERLFVYAHVQRQSRKAAVKAQCSDETAVRYRPAMGLLAKLMPTRCAPLDAVAAAPRVPSVPRDEPAAIQSSTSALPRCWREFLSRSAERERHRLARLRKPKLQVVESAVEECTFHPRLSPQTSRCPARDCDSSGAAPHATPCTTIIDGEERGSHARPEEWAAALAMFEAEMQALQNTLVRFRQARTPSTYTRRGLVSLTSVCSPRCPPRRLHLARGRGLTRCWHACAWLYLSPFARELHKHLHPDAQTDARLSVRSANAHVSAQRHASCFSSCAPWHTMDKEEAYNQQVAPDRDGDLSLCEERPPPPDA